MAIVLVKILLDCKGQRIVKLADSKERIYWFLYVTEKVIDSDMAESGCSNDTINNLSDSISCTFG